MHLSPTTLDRYRVAASIGIMSLILAWFSVAIGGLGLVLLWPAAAFGAVGLAYAGFGVLVFGKKNGRLPWHRKLLLWPWLAIQRVTVLAGLLLKLGAVATLDEAEARLKAVRPGVGLSVGQRRTLEKLKTRGRI